MQTKPPNQYAPLPLAYIGDAVYEVYVRTRLIAEHPDMAAHKLHVHSIKYVKAHAQSNSIHAMLPILTDDETAVFRRGRNAKSPTFPITVTRRGLKRFSAICTSRTKRTGLTSLWRSRTNTRRTREKISKKRCKNRFNKK